MMLPSDQDYIGPTERIDTSHPFAQSLRHAWYFCDPQFVPDRMGVNHARATATGLLLGNSGQHRTSTGKDDSTGLRLNLDADAALADGEPWTITFRAKQNAAANGTQGMLLGNRNDTASFVWLRRGTYFRFRTASAHTAGFGNLTNFDDWHTYSVSADTASRIYLHRDGVPIQDTLLASSDFTLNSFFSAYTSDSFSLDGNVEFAFVHDKRLTDEEVAALHALDPYELLDRDEAHYALGAGGAATVNAASRADSWSALQATISVPANVDATAQASTWTTYQASISTSNDVEAASQTVSWAAHQATISQPSTVDAASRASTWAALPATIQIIQAESIDAALGRNKWTGLRATIDAGSSSGGWMVRPITRKEEEDRAAQIQRERIERGIIEPPKKPVISLGNKPGQKADAASSTDALRAAIDSDVIDRLIAELSESIEEPDTFARRRAKARKAAAVLLLTL